MAKKLTEPAKAATSGLTHNPFSKLASDAKLATGRVDAAPVAPVILNRPVPAPPSARLTMRHESKGRGGKAVTRISGLPHELLETVASRLRKALGCGATIEGEDVILLGSLRERAAEWFERLGDVRKLAEQRPASAVHKPEPTPERIASPSIAPHTSPTKRSGIRRGLRVAIVMKADQDTGKLTEGIVRDLLTNSTEHPRGIKVRLESGEVGRVKIVLG